MSNEQEAHSHSGWCTGHKEDSERSPQGYASGGVLPPGVDDYVAELERELSSGCYIHPRAARLMGKPETWIPVEYIDEAVRTRMDCGRTTVHPTHFWQYSATGWVTCHGIQETTPIYAALMTMHEKFVDPFADIELDQRFVEEYEYRSADEENGL